MNILFTIKEKQFTLTNKHLKKDYILFLHIERRNQNYIVVYSQKDDMLIHYYKYLLYKI